MFANTAVAAGQPYDAAVIQGLLQKYETTLRGGAQTAPRLAACLAPLDKYLV